MIYGSAYEIFECSVSDLSGSSRINVFFLMIKSSLKCGWMYEAVDKNRQHLRTNVP